MQTNILRDSSVTNIFLFYTDAGQKRSLKVKLRFMDDKSIYFSAPVPVNFEKPKKGISAEINVYTIDGVYKANTIINDNIVNVQEILYEVQTPKTYNFVQLRNSSRIRLALPVKIKYNDGFEISATTFDIAVGGIAFYSKETFSSIYKTLPAELTLELPNSMFIVCPEKKINVSAKFVREKQETNNTEYYAQHLYCYKFVNTPQTTIDILKDLLLRNS